MNSHHIFSLRLDDLSGQELGQLFSDWLNGSEPKTVVTPNPEFCLLARRDKEFAKLLSQSDLSLPDGVGLKYAVAALTDQKLEHRHTGVDTLEYLASTGARLVLVGGKKEIAEKAAENLKRKFTSSDIIVIDPGQVPEDGTPTMETIEALKKSEPKILAVALGQGKQEKFIAKILPELPSVRIAIGVGGAPDMISGQLPRAPLFMRQIGLEWLWRLVIEPKRWLRIFRAVVVFPAIVIWATISERRFWSACRNVLKEWL
ncbi:MAG: WecB/TagA/CpsF family glycosyltransferase [Candidatus Uhrbacteria bacterium]